MWAGGHAGILAPAGGSVACRKTGMTLGSGQCHSSLQVTFQPLISAKPGAKVVPAF